MEKSSTSDVPRPGNRRYDIDEPRRFEAKSGMLPKTSNRSDVLPQSDVRIDIDRQRRYTHGSSAVYEASRGTPIQPSRSADFVYVNPAYVGSMHSVSEPRTLDPPTGVYREQYWACSKWPYGQKLLAIAVGVLFGAVVGLMVSLILKRPDGEAGILDGIFRSQPVPD